MGQCLLKSKQNSNSQRKSLSISVTTKNFKDSFRDYQKNLIKKIHALHRISLKCKEAIEKCIINNSKDLALLLRAKRFYIKANLQSLQTLVSKIDDTLNDSEAKNNAIKFLAGRCEKVLKESNALLDDNIESLMSQDSQAIENTNNEILRFSVMSSEVQKENERDFKTQFRLIKRRAFHKKLKNAALSTTSSIQL